MWARLWKTLRGCRISSVFTRQAWVCGCVGGCVGVWVCGCVGVWVCGCVGMWVCGCVGVWVCGCVGVGVGVWVCGCVGWLQPQGLAWRSGLHVAADEVEIVEVIHLVLVERIKGRVADQMVDIPVRPVIEEIMTVVQEKEKLATQERVQQPNVEHAPVRQILDETVEMVRLAPCMSAIPDRQANCGFASVCGRDRRDGAHIIECNSKLPITLSMCFSLQRKLFMW